MFYFWGFYGILLWKEFLSETGEKMNILIYFIIAVLFVVLIFWTWNNTKDFEETSRRVIFIVVGIVLIAIVTLIYFAISKVGITYPKV